jgi:hypothetical protein
LCPANAFNNARILQPLQRCHHGAFGHAGCLGNGLQGRIAPSAMHIMEMKNENPENLQA